MKIPSGWTAHDGKAMPVAGDSCPAIMLRCGLTVAMGERFASDWPAGWKWAELPSGMDIIAYRDEASEFVTVPRLG